MSIEQAPQRGGGPKIFYTVTEAMRALGLKRTTLYALIGSGRLEAKRFGARRTLITAASLHAFADGLPDAGIGRGKKVA